MGRRAGRGPVEAPRPTRQLEGSLQASHRGRRGLGNGRSNAEALSGLDETGRSSRANDSRKSSISLPEVPADGLSSTDRSPSSDGQSDHGIPGHRRAQEGLPGSPRRSGRAVRGAIFSPLYCASIGARRVGARATSRTSKPCIDLDGRPGRAGWWRRSPCSRPTSTALSPIISPYSPTSRLFWNEFYLDLGQNPRVGTHCEAARQLLEWPRKNSGREVEALRSEWASSITDGR